MQESKMNRLTLNKWSYVSFGYGQPSKITYMRQNICGIPVKYISSESNNPEERELYNSLRRAEKHIVFLPRIKIKTPGKEVRDAGIKVSFDGSAST